jgi:hypothetical protein
VHIKRLTTAESIGKNPLGTTADQNTVVVKSYSQARPVIFPYNLVVELTPGVEITIGTNYPVDLLPGNLNNLNRTLTKHLHRSLTGSVLYLSTNKKQNLLSATLWTWGKTQNETDVSDKEEN